MAEGASPNASTNVRNLSLCNECGLNPCKYRCPGCSIRSCSLPCVNSHKKRTNCTGKRRCTDVVPLSQFDDKLLLSDYKLLEETKRVAESARRKNSGFIQNPRFKLPNKLRMLRNAANWRRIRLLLYPHGLSKRRNNRSRYDKRKKSIFWTIELRFHGTDVTIIHHGVDEHGSLLSIFGKHLAPGPWKHMLRPFSEVQLEDLKLFLRKNPKDSKSPYRKLDIKAPIGSQFEDTMILEYPVIFVYLPSHDTNFEVERGRTPPPSACNDAPTPDFTLYKEEEVEEGDEASDSRTTDLMDIPNSFESMDAGFYFEQEVRDAYADLLGEMNPDDFLCLDGVCNGELDQLAGYAFEASEGNDLGEDKGGNPCSNSLDEMVEVNGLVERAGDKEEKRENFFFSDVDPFGEVELEEGEIPFFLC